MSLLAPLPLPSPQTDSPHFEAADRRWTELKTERAQDERLWQRIAQEILPQRGGFGLDNPASRIDEPPLSSAPLHAHSNFAAGLYGTLTNPANRWFGLETDDEELNAWHPMKMWLGTVAARCLASFSPAVSPFYSSSTQIFGDLAGFGNGIQYDELVPEERRILDITVSLAEVCLDIDGFGRVCEAVRRFRLKPAAAVNMFGAQAVPARVLDLAQKSDQGQIVFFHHIVKNDAWRKGSFGPRGKPWISRYTCEVDRALVREAGYTRMPFYAARWQVDTGRTYGIGPGFVELASAAVLRRMEDATVRMAQRQADPTILAPDRDAWQLNGKIRPGSVVYGGVGPRGDALIRPLELAGGFSLTLQEKQAKREEIMDAFHYTLMQLAGRTGMTATEVMTINEERQRLWAPHQGRVQEEFLQPKIDGRFQMLWEAGQLPPPPPEAAGRALRVKYLSAASAAQRSAEGNNVLRLIADLAPLMQIKPRLADRLDDDGLVEVLADARGVPARALRSREAADALAQARAEQAQAAQAMAAAQAGAAAMKDGAQAMAMMEQGGGA